MGLHALNALHVALASVCVHVLGSLQDVHGSWRPALSGAFVAGFCGAVAPVALASTALLPQTGMLWGMASRCLMSMRCCRAPTCILPTG